MKLINKSHFFSIVCICFTLIVCGKLCLEKMYDFTDRYYTENIFTILAVSILITLILSIHYHLRQFPFILVFIAQYVATIGIVFLGIKIMGIFSDMAPTAYKDMFISVTVPFFGAAIVYYIIFFSQIRKANKLLEKLEEKERQE